MPASSALPLPEPQEIRLVPPGFAPDRLMLAATSDIAALRSAWRGFETHAAGHVFQSWAFVSNWHNSIGRPRGLEPFIVTASSRDGALRLLLPLAIRSGRAGRWLEWLGGEHADYKGPLVDRAWLDAADPGTVRQVLEEALRLAPGVDAAALEDMPAALGGRAHPFRAFAHAIAPVSAHSVRLEPDFDAFLRARRGAGSRKKLRQKRRRLESATGSAPAFTIARTPQMRARAMTALVAQKRARLAERGIGDMFAEPGVRAFYRALAERHPELCQLSTLDAGDMTLAANWGLVWHGRYYYVLSTMTDGPLRSHSPGQIHLHDLMAWSAAHGIETFDFTAGDEAYKDDWCDTVEPLFDVHLGFTARGRVLAALRAGARAAKREIKANPHAWALAQALRRRIRAAS